MDFVQETTSSIPSFTIIIPVIHSIEDLERCLSSLDNLDYPKERFHVVLVDCHVLYGLKQFCTENLHKYGFSVSMLSIPEKPDIEPSRHVESRLNEARNYAIQNVSGKSYVFTVDDCTFEPDWLHKIECALNDKVGALGGPDIFPEGMGWFLTALDCVLNSYIGTAGMRRGNGYRSNQYYPRKENMAISARVLNHVGNFPKEKIYSGDMEMANTIREAGFQIKFLPDNPVRHRRVTSFSKFLQNTVYVAFEKVQFLREQNAFIKSLHFLVLIASIGSILIGLFSLVSNYACVLLVILAGVYLVALVSTAVLSAFRVRNILVGLGVFMLLPAYHASLTYGIIKGTITKIKSNYR
jgi:GT2 family glycosyltransferase